MPNGSKRLKPSVRFLEIIVALTAAANALSAPDRAFLEPGVTAGIRGGRMLHIECQLPPGDAAKPLLERYLNDPGEWTDYRGLQAVAIPFAKLNIEARGAVLTAIFPQDTVEADGWLHRVTFKGADGSETWWCIAEWFTGIGTNYHELMNHPRNANYAETLQLDQVVYIPADLLIPPLKAQIPRSQNSEEPVFFDADDHELTYGSDKQGPYALYRLKKGEALYTAVVARFTDYRENADILKACDVIQKRSGVRNVHKMGAGQKILIPLEMLSDRYQPAGSERRREYESVQQEAQRLQATRVRAKGLEGVVIILDPGHGGRDHGAAFPQHGIYEDEINYDIVCRIKRLLETQTKAKVHVTVKDPNQGYAPTDAKRFTHDTDEVLLTSPPYDNYDAKVSANLRWYLVNHIYRKERVAGVDERQILFASIHCDALYNDKMRGAMVYVPGANYRRNSETPSGSIYNRFEEVRGHREAKSTPSEHRRDEALSRNFAEALLHALATNNPPIKVHSTGDPIRNVIRQSGGRAYLPAVLRNTMTPTKVLVEVANLTNPTDRERAADPKWRQWFAEAFVAAVIKHFNS